MKRFIVGFLFVVGFLHSTAQSPGGSSLFSFLKLPNTPQLTALGGVNVSNISGDIGMAFNNPALLRPDMHAQLTAVFNAMYAGIRNYHLMAGYFSPFLQTNFAVGVHYFDYGSIPQTDASGNILGSFRPGDYVAQISASRKYEEHWHYGLTLKFIHSNYGLYRSNGIAVDAAAAYYDSTRFLQAAIVLKNMGTQLKRYEGSQPDALPFDLQVGITKRLQKAPVQFSLTAHHLHQFDILYNDTSFNNENGFRQKKAGALTIDNVLNHLVAAGQVFIGERLEITAAYNRLRRSELNIANSTNGLNGFSLGVGALFRKLQIRYARSYYQNNTAYNQFGLNIKMNEYFGLGDLGQRIGW